MNQFDAIVIGSGFGGAVAACRLAEAGQRVLVLERGKRWQPDEFPRGPGDQWLFDVDEPEKQHGWIDLRIFRQISVAQGAGVGGGSLIYANVSVPAPEASFETGWPQAIRHAELLPHFAAVGRMLDVQELPDSQLTERFKLVREAATALGHGHRHRKLPLAIRFDPDWRYDRNTPHDRSGSRQSTNAFGREQGSCIHCGNCDIGCPVGARNTLDLNYLAVAEDKGAQIRPLHLVHAVEPADSGYKLHGRRLDAGEDFSVAAKRVIIAAGSLGSTELLLRSRDEYHSLPELSPRLGQGWCANGDFLTPAVYARRTVSPTLGPTITCAIDYLDGEEDGQRYFVEDGGFPDVVGNLMRATLRRNKGVPGSLLHAIWKRTLRPALRERDSLSGMMPWFGQAMDAPGGVMTLRRQWFRRHKRLMLRYDVRPSRAVIQAMINRHLQLSQATGGRASVPLSWRWFKYLVTPHPLGGCNMGSSRADGVVDHRGEVFGYPGLYVLDGAIVPRALGLNPSRTIAALAERAMALMLE